MEAIETLNARISDLRGGSLIIACARSGQLERARELAARLVAADPTWRISRRKDTQFRTDVALDADLAALRAVELPE